MDKILRLVEKHKDIIVYLIFGALTTIVNYLVYLPFHNLLGVSAAVSNVVAWLIAVIFAYLTNKPFVFNSNDWSRAVVVPEFTKFIGCRVGSGAFETLFLLLTVDFFQFNGSIMKLITSVIVVILNYIGSKWLVFQGKK